MQPPTVVVAILARNSAHSLPYYLGALERLRYPKDRISVWWVIFITVLLLTLPPPPLLTSSGSVTFAAPVAFICGASGEKTAAELLFLVVSGVELRFRSQVEERFLFLLLPSPCSLLPPPSAAV